MAGLQRSAVSFRRQGSSGLVWDDKFLQELNKQSEREDQDQDQDLDSEKPEINAANTTVRSINTVERSRSTGGGRGYRTGKVSPAIEPPSPKLSACGFCGAFSKTGDKGKSGNFGKHRSR